MKLLFIQTEDFSQESLCKEDEYVQSIATSLGSDETWKMTITKDVTTRDVFKGINNTLKKLKLKKDSMLAVVWSSHGESGQQLHVNKEIFDAAHLFRLLSKVPASPGSIWTSAATTRTDV